MSDALARDWDDRLFGGPVPKPEPTEHGVRVEAIVLEGWREGRTVAAIAAHIGQDPAWVEDYAARLGLPQREPPAADRRLEDVRTLLEEAVRKLRPAVGAGPFPESKGEHAS